MKISHKVPLIVTSIILSSFAVFGFLQHKTLKENIYQQSQSSVHEVAHALEAQITMWLKSQLQKVSTMSEIIGDNVDKENIKAIMATKALAPGIINYYAVLEQGEGKIIGGREFGLPSNWDGRKRPWYKLAMRKNDAVFTSPYVDDITGNLIVSAATPLNGKGVVAADISLKSISDALNTVYFNKTGYAFLVDENGDIISHPDRRKYGVNISKNYLGSGSVTTPILHDVEVNGRDLLSIFYALDNFENIDKKWYIGIIIDKKKLFAPVENLAINTAITAAITALIASVLSYLFMASSLIKPAQRLAKQSSEISRGEDFSDIIEGVNRKDEIGDLALAVQRMQKALGMAINRLKK